MDCHGLPWTAMDSHGLPWTPMDSHDLTMNESINEFSNAWRLLLHKQAHHIVRRGHGGARQQPHQ
eukprot:4392815-Lingulodinium_polyedra.AAC.1